MRKTSHLAITPKKAKIAGHKADISLYLILKQLYLVSILNPSVRRTSHLRKPKIRFNRLFLGVDIERLSEFLLVIKIVGWRGKSKSISPGSIVVPRGGETKSWLTKIDGSRYWHVLSS